MHRAIVLASLLAWAGQGAACCDGERALVEQELRANYLQHSPTAQARHLASPPQALALVLATLALAGLALGGGAATLVFLKTLKA